MAEIALQLVIEKLGTLISQEANLLGGVSRGVVQLSDDLESMRSFLQDAEERSDTDEGIKTWVKQVRDVAYDTDDVISEFLLRLSPPHGYGFFGSIRKIIHYIQHMRTRHRLGVQIENIKKRVKSISDNRNAFSFQMINVAASSSNVQLWHDPRMNSLFIDESDLVGIENPKSLLINWLVGGVNHLTTVSVVGMGGVGKTTLVKKTFDSHQVKKQFDCCAWITVSKSFTAAGLLQAALKSFLEYAKEKVPESINMMGHVELVEVLKNYLQNKRYVVVLDDVWDINAWDSVKFAFPDCDCRSRIVFTTRIVDVAKAVETPLHVYELKPLKEDAAWTLFCKKAFCGEYKGVCTQELEEMSRAILKRCSGLPLAIVAIGGLLSRKNKLTLEWKKIHDSLATEMKNNTSLQCLEKILVLSYKDLPYHLKCCYLYLSVFPEDYLIKRMKLVRLWVVERFVEEKAGFTREEVAEDYLNELVSRSMIQVVRKDFLNRVLTCRVHDLMREIIQSKAMEESFVVTLNDSMLTLGDKVRRIAVHDTCKDFPSAMKFRNLRSLLLFRSIECSSSLKGKGSFYGFKLLRVLELEGAPLTEFPIELTRMIHLRYLSLRRTKIRELPESIGKLQSLEILDLKHSLITSIPDGILNLKNLSQLRNYTIHLVSYSVFGKDYGTRVPAGIGKLRSLQKLGSVDVSGNSDIVRELGNLNQLRRLSILKLSHDDGVNLCYSLEKMKRLTTLYMASIAPNEPVPLDSLSSPPQFLQRLYIKCSLPTLPKWIESLRYLAKLVLQHCNLNHDPLKTLQVLPNLVTLELREAYGGEEVRCEVGGYPRLRMLSVCLLKQLKYIRIEEGAMPDLRRLEIMLCVELENVPFGIEHLERLQEFVLVGMSPVFLEKIDPSQGEDFSKVQHIAEIRYISLLNFERNELSSKYKESKLWRRKLKATGEQ